MSNHQNIYSDEDLPDYTSERETAQIDRRSVDVANAEHQMELACDGTTLLRALVDFTKLHVGLKEK
jgi:hypothetical protein